VTATLVSFAPRGASSVDATARTQRSRCPQRAAHDPSTPHAPHTDRRSLLAGTALGPGLGWLGTSYDTGDAFVPWLLALMLLAVTSALLAIPALRRRSLARAPNAR